MPQAFSWDSLPDAENADSAAAPSVAKFSWDAFPDHPDSGKSPSLLNEAAKSTIDSLPMLGGVVGGILGTPADALTGPAGTIGGAAIGGYFGTAAKNLINKFYDPASAPQSTTEAITQPIIGGLEQGLMQGSGEAVAPYITKGIQAAGNAAKWAGTKALSSAFGVNPDIINEYAQYSDRINSAPSVDKLKDISDKFVGQLASDVDAKNITLQQANDAYKGFQSDLKDAYKTAGYDARDAVTSAQQTLKDAHNSKIQQVASDVYDTVKQLKSDVQSGSGKALDLLDKSGAQVDLSPVYSQIDKSIGQLQQAGTDESLAAASKLQAYKARTMENNWAQIPAPDAKKLIQGLDKITAYNSNASTFDDVKNSAFKDIRSALDQSLKETVPEYKAAMIPVAADASLLSRVGDFGDKQTAAGLLGRINAPNQMERNAALQELGQKYGTDFINAVDPSKLPERSILNKAQAIQDSLRPDRVADKIQQTLASSRQSDALSSAQSGLDQAQENLAPFKPLAPNNAGQTSAQQKLEQLSKGDNIELNDMFSKLGKLTNTDFVQAMKDRNIQAAFQKGATNGSRNAFTGTVLGWAVGGLGGAAVGVNAGRAVDQWGPAITKKILDGAIKISENPAVSTVAKLNLPDPIKKNMIIGLENYLSKGSQVAEQALPMVAGSGQQPNRAPAKGPDAWAQQGIQKLGIQDQDLVNQLLQSPKGKQLLIQASDLAPGSKAMQRINDQIQKGFGRKQ